MRFLELIGDPVLSFLTFVGECSTLVGDSFRRLLHKFEFAETLNQMAFVGVSSVPIVVMTSFFSGAVLALYLSQFLGAYGVTTFVGATVALSVAREIGPVIAAIMVAARCGSAMAAQMGSMNVTEQIDALRMLSVHPTSYLVIPRLVASVLMLPVLALIGIWSGIFGGMIVAEAAGIPRGVFVDSIRSFVLMSDFWGGLAKAPVFGLIIALVACQQGLRTRDGAAGVGRATTNSVVIAMVLIYISNFLLARVLF